MLCVHGLVTDLGVHLAAVLVADLGVHLGAVLVADLAHAYSGQ